MQTIKEKIAKLLERASRIKEGAEAEAALLLAQELMVKHSIEMGELSLEQEESNQKEVSKEYITRRRKTPWWHVSLSVVIAENFRCQAFRNIRDGGSMIGIVGLKEDVEIAKQVFFAAVEMADNCLKAYCKKHGYKVSDVKNDYMLGFVDGLKAKFKEQVDREGWALILVKDEAVVQAIDRLKLRHKKQPINTRNNRSAYNTGYHEGKSFSSNRLHAAGSM